MRDFKVDLSATTDANGNATIPVPIPQSGEWHNLKFTFSLSGIADWTVSVAGTPVTHGRGRRVTIGPELIRDHDKVVVSLLNGPPVTSVVGSANGISGSMNEVLQSFIPQPNTIALDTANPRQKMYPDGTAIPTDPATPSFTVPLQSSATKTFTLPLTATAVRIMAIHPGGPGALHSTAAISVVGLKTGILYANILNAGAVILPPSRPIDIRVEPTWDPQVQVIIDATGDPGITITDVFVSALFGAETTVVAGQTNSNQGLPVSLQAATPALWQAPRNAVALSGALNAGTTTTIVAGIANQTIYLFDVVLVGGQAGTFGSFLDGASSIGSWFIPNAGFVNDFDYGGMPITAGNDFKYNNLSGTNLSSQGGVVTYSQG